MPTPDRTTTQRGYGTEHRKLRKAVAAQVQAGTAYCARCGLPIQPDEPFDLGHDDHDRTKYLGPEHRTCNRAAGATQGNQARGQQGPAGLPTGTPSRTW